jgi:hypothetical protein
MPSRGTNAARIGQFLHAFPTAVLRVLVSWLERTSIALRWLRDRARRLLRHFRSPGMQNINAWTAWYNDLYRSVGDGALQSLQPGERMPELILHDIEGNHQQLSCCWDEKPALLVTMSLSCGQSRRHALALRRLSRRFEQYINTVVIYVVEAHPIDAPSPYADRVNAPSPDFDRICVPPMNEIAGIQCAQPRTFEERIELAHQLRRRFRLSASMLIDGLDDRAWRTFGCAPNTAILVQPDSRIAVKQGWFEPQEMERAITVLLLKNSVVIVDD